MRHIFVFLGALAFSQARKRHIKLNFLVRVGLGTTPRISLGQPGFVPGANPLCLRDKPGFSLLFYTVEAQFVPGTSPGCPWDKGRQKKFMC